MTQDRIDSISVAPVGESLEHRQVIAELCLSARLPTVFGYRDNVDAGGLMSYGNDVSDSFRGCATYVGRILKGAKPTDLPIQQPSKFELVINLKTAKALGLTLPTALLFGADEVIE